MNKKILLSLLVVAVLGGAAVLSTTAFFSDTEASTGNVFTAGAIDLKVDNTSHYNGYVCEGGTWQCEDWADFVVSFDQGKRKDGSLVLENRSDPSKTLGEAESTGAASDSPVINDTFASLGWHVGFGGSIVLGFTNKIMNGTGNDLKIFEVTGGSYPDEQVKVEVSKNGVDWVLASPSVVTRDGEVDLNSLDWAKYVKLTDVSNKAIFEATADGYDLDAVKALHCESDPIELLNTSCDLTWGMEDIGLTARKFFNFLDVKPGDRGESTISLHLEDNPAYACMMFGNLVNDENELIEPEKDLDLSNDVGELGETMDFLVWKDDGDNIWEADEEVLAGPLTANEIMDNQSYGLALPEEAWEPGEDRFVGISWCAGKMTVDTEINSILCDPTGMGNQAQTDKLTVDISFYVEQSRHNAGFVCPVVSPSPSPSPSGNPTSDIEE